MPPRDLVRSRRIACLVGALGAAALACTQLEWTKAHAQGVNRADALAQALVDNAPRHVPKGYASARGSRTALNDDDRRAGMAAGVQVALGGGDPKGSLRYGLFPSEQQAAAFARDLVQRTPRGSALKFLQYLPSADCADTPNGGLCSLRIGDVVIIATASQVDRGASLVLLAAKEALEAETANLRASPATATPTPRPDPAARRRERARQLRAADESRRRSRVGRPRRRSAPEQRQLLLRNPGRKQQQRDVAADRGRSLQVRFRPRPNAADRGHPGHWRRRVRLRLRRGLCPGLLHQGQRLRVPDAAEHPGREPVGECEGAGPQDRRAALASR